MIQKEMKKRKLQDVADVILGIVQTRVEIKYQSDSAKRYNLFSLKSYDEDLPYDIMYSEKSLENYLTKKGDIIFRKGYPTRIIIVDEKIENLLIVSQFCIIRGNKDFNPYFIKWYLESDDAKIQLERDLIGTVALAVNTEAIRNIEIPEISKETEEKIEQLLIKWNEQKNFYDKIINLKEEYYSKAIKKIYKKESK